MVVKNRDFLGILGALLSRSVGTLGAVDRQSWGVYSYICLYRLPVVEACLFVEMWTTAGQNRAACGRRKLPTAPALFEQPRRHFRPRSGHAARRLQRLHWGMYSRRYRVAGVSCHRVGPLGTRALPRVHLLPVRPANGNPARCGPGVNMSLYAITAIALFALSNAG